MTPSFPPLPPLSALPKTTPETVRDLYAQAEKLADQHGIRDRQAFVANYMHLARADQILAEHSRRARLLRPASRRQFHREIA